MSLPLAHLRAVGVIGAILFSGAGLCTAGQITSSLTVRGTLGSPLQYQITADNQPTSFDAENLFPGLSLNRTTGVISGVPNLSGGLDTRLTAHSPSGDAVATCLFLAYLPIPANDPISSGFNVECTRMLADPNRPRIYCGGSNQELVVIDTDTMSIVTRIPNTGYIADMSIAPDGQTLWFVRTYLNSLARANLNTLDGFTPVPVSMRLDGVREGLDNRLYGITQGHEILQINPATGEIQQRFQADEPHPASALSLAISPDRRTLYVGDAFYVGDSLVTHSAISRYDISTAIPAFLQRVEMPSHRVQDLVAGPNDDSIYAVLGSLDGPGSITTHQTLCLSGQNLSIKGSFSFQGTATNSVTITADGRRALQPVELGDGGANAIGLVNIFDTQSFQLLKRVVLGSDTYTVYVGDAVLDQSGSRMFVSTALSPALRVYPITFPTPPVTPPKSLLNISTRMLTQNGDNVLIGGFIIAGNESKKVILRGIGPSLPVAGKLEDPVLELHGPGGAMIAENDNWNSHRNEVIATGIPPADEYEAALVATLQPGPYTAILRGSAGTAGIAIIEAYDLSASADSRLANISTRGKVETGNNVMIGGWIIGGGESTRVVVRAIGPSLAVIEALTDPMIEAYNGNGTLLAQNDDWRTHQEQPLIDSGLAPADNRESAIMLDLLPGNYTAIVRGKENTTGIALVEVYNLR